MKEEDPQILFTLITRPTRILGMIPHLLGCTILGSFSVGFIVTCVGGGGFFLAFTLFILGIGGSLWVTHKDEDIIRILWARRFFKNKKQIYSSRPHYWA